MLGSQSFRADFHIFNRLSNEFERYSICILFPINKYSLLCSVEASHITLPTGRGVGLPNLMKLLHMVVSSLDILISPMEKICCRPLKIPQRSGSSEL